MKQQKDRNNSTMSKWMRLIFTICSFSLIFIVTAFGQNSGRDKSGWQATIVCDSVPVYSHMSTDSSQLRFLKKGEAVIIDLEIIGVDGAWCFVREPGQRMRLGYIQSECLEWNRPALLTMRQIESPTSQSSATSTAELIRREEATRLKDSSRNEIKEQVENVVDERLRDLLRMNSPIDIPSERVELGNQVESFLLFQPSTFVHQKLPFMLSRGSFFNQLTHPVVPPTSRGLFCNPFGRPLSSVSIGAHVITGRTSGRR